MGKRTIDSITGMDVDDSGNVYATGEATYPATAPDNSTTIYMLKLNADSGIPEFVSYIIANIGTVNNPIKVDSLENVYTAGIVRPQTNFPVTENAFDQDNEEQKCFILKLNSNGNKIDYSTFLGGNGYNLVYDLDVDKNGYAFVAGYTGSKDFPTTSGAYDTIYNDVYNGYITKFNSNGSALIFSTFLAGARISDIYIDNFSDIYLTGLTGSYKFPITEGSYSYQYNKTLTSDFQSDVFVTKLDKDGKNLIFSTHFGGMSGEAGNAIKINETGEIFITGTTSSSDFPITQNAFDPSFNGGETDIFLIELNSDASSIIYSTFIGGSENDVSNGLVFDNMGNLFINGYTRSLNFPVIPDVYENKWHGDWDFNFI